MWGCGSDAEGKAGDVECERRRYVKVRLSGGVRSSEQSTGGVSMSVFMRLVPYLMRLSKDRLIAFAAHLGKRLPGWLAKTVPSGGFASATAAKEWVLRIAQNPVAQFLVLEAVIDFFTADGDTTELATAKQELVQEFGLGPESAVLFDDRVKKILHASTGDGEGSTVWGKKEDDLSAIMDDQAQANTLIEGGVRALGSFQDFVALYLAINTVELKQIEFYRQLYRK